MGYTVLVSAPQMRPISDKLRRIFRKDGIKTVLPPVKERLSEDALLPLVGDIDGAICGDDQFTRRVMDAAPKLKVIAKWGAGTDCIDEAAAKELGIAVRSTPGAFTEAVADTVLGYMLCFARRLPWMDRDVHGGRWQRVEASCLWENTLGVLGVGRIGKAVVRRAIAFGMRVIGCDITVMPLEFRSETGIEMMPRDDLLAQADFVSINCDLTPANHHLIGARELEIMKPSACLINTASGRMVDERALVAALKAGSIAGAALDVFEEEPPPPHSLLRLMDNCLLAPHNAGASPEALERVHQNTVRNLLDVLKVSEGGSARA